MARTKAAASIPTNGKDSWRTPPRELFLFHRMLGGISHDDPAPRVPGVAPMWQPNMWDLDAAWDRYLDCLAWLREHGCIYHDPCADRDSAYHFAEISSSQIGLDPDFPWVRNSFANVPYSKTKQWVAHAAAQSALWRESRTIAGNNTLLLIPASLTNLYWVEHLLCPGRPVHPFGPGVNLLATTRGRISFIGPEGPVSGNPLGSAAVGWVDPSMGDHMVRELEAEGWVVHRRPARSARISLLRPGLVSLRRAPGHLADICSTRPGILGMGC